MLPRFSIARLLAVIALCGVGFAALRSPSQMWASALFAVSLGSLPVALLNAIYSRERRRAFWTGFLVIGGSYFVATQGPWFKDEFGPRMVTTAVLDILYVQVAPAPTPPASPASTLLAQAAALNQTNANAVYRQAEVLAISLAGPTPKTAWAAWSEPDRTSGVGLQVGNLALASPETFRRVGHAFLTLLLAALGGLYARGRYAGTP
jgi:hypothetical protein